MGDELLSTIDVRSELDERGDVRAASIRFGPHHLVDVWREGERTRFRLVMTHHGFEADASDLGGELERVIDHVRRAFPALVVD